MARPEVTGKKAGRRLLDYQALRERGIPWSRVHIARLEAAGKFPRHIDLGANSIAWFGDEVDAFLEEKAAESDAKVRQAVPRQKTSGRRRSPGPALVESCIGGAKNRERSFSQKRCGASRRRIPRQRRRKGPPPAGRG